MEIKDASWELLANYAAYVTAIIANSKDQPYSFMTWYDKVASV